MDAEREHGAQHHDQRDMRVPGLATRSPPPPTSMMPISAVLTMRMIRALSCESASCPASAENRKNGRMNDRGGERA